MSLVIAHLDNKERKIMKVKEVIPVISDIVVVIDGLKYKDTACSFEGHICIEVNCHCVSDGEPPIFHITKASCKEPYFVMGRGFWEDEFGKRQTNRIIKICNEAIENYLKNS